MNFLFDPRWESPVFGYIPLGVVIGLLLCIPVYAVIWVAEAQRFAGFRQWLTNHTGKIGQFMSMTLKVTAALALVAGSLYYAPSAHASTECGYARQSVRVVALTDETSCPFALATANTMMNGGGNPMLVYSPITGQSYSMHCMIEQHGSTTCRGGNNAAVQIF